MLDRDALLDHIRKRADAQVSLPAAAVLDGLVTAIERGDFDNENPHIFLSGMKKEAKKDGATVVSR